MSELSGRLEMGKDCAERRTIFSCFRRRTDAMHQKTEESHLKSGKYNPFLPILSGVHPESDRSCWTCYGEER